MTTILSVVESPGHPNFTALFERLGLDARWVKSMRRAIAEVKRSPPDWIVAEFFYGYGNNYAGVNISNLDVLLYTLQRYAPESRVVVLVDIGEREYVTKLNEILGLRAVLVQPVGERALEAVLTSSPS